MFATEYRRSTLAVAAAGSSTLAVGAASADGGAFCLTGIDFHSILGVCIGFGCGSPSFGGAFTVPLTQ